MAGWIAEYRAKRPGLKVLQQRVDEWLADFDKKEEQVSFWSARHQECGDDISLYHMRLFVFLHRYSVWHWCSLFGIMHKDALACVYIFVVYIFVLYICMCAYAMYCTQCINAFNVIVLLSHACVLIYIPK